MGDLSFHVCCPGKPLMKYFNDILNSFGLTQAVNVPTHKSHVLDLVVYIMDYILTICLLMKL